MNHFHRLLLTALLFCVTATVAMSAATPVTLSGVVSDPARQPIEFATVRVAGTAIGTNTDEKGAWRLTLAEADTVDVIFSCIGYSEVKRRLINPEGEVRLNVMLQPVAQEIGEVEISEIRKQTGSMQRIDAAEYRLRAADPSGGSIESLLATMGGVNASSELSSQYSVRGGSYDENSVYINGVELYRPLLVTSGQQEGLSVINPDMTGTVEFSSGGFGGEYADKMSSALDITYRTPTAFEGSASVSLMGASASVGAATGNFSQLHGLRYKRNSSLLSSMDTKGEYDPSFFDYQTSLNLKIGKRLNVSFLGNIAINDYHFTPRNRTTNFGTSTDAKQFKVYFDGHEKDKFNTYFGALGISYAASRRTALQLLASGFLTDELVTYDISGEYWLDEAGTGDGSVGGELGVGRYHEHARDRLRAKVAAVTLRGNTAVNNTYTLAYGVTGRREQIHERTREWELRDSAGYSLPVNNETLRMVYNLASAHDISSTRLSAYVKNRLRFHPAAGYVNIQADLRVSYWDFNREWLVSPRASVGFIPEANTSWALRFATGIYYQSPFYKEFRLTVTDPATGNATVQLNKAIKSPRSIHFILGADYTFRALSRPFKLTGEIYYKTLSRIIPYEIDNLKVIYSGLNESSGHAMGLDVKLFGQFVPGSDSWLTFSLMNTSENLHGVKVPSPSDRRYSVGLYFTDFFPRIPRLKVSLRGIFADGLPATASRTGRDEGYFRTPAYKRVDFGIMYGIILPPAEGETRHGLRGLWAGIDIFNLFDMSNVSSYYWVTDVNNIRYAVPNYLTRRQLNLRLTIDF
ncbi:MAG: TonB-dependent receptor [Paramuribaculum sp.]|nr:TonB-dependent receptor [Paramuribaculum sp.]